MSRTQIQMIGVTQNNLSVKFLQRVLRYGLDGTGSSHRHKRWRFYGAMRGLYASKPRCADLGFDGERKRHEPYSTSSPSSRSVHVIPTRSEGSAPLAHVVVSEEQAVVDYVLAFFMCRSAALVDLSGRVTWPG